ncbi:MAG TPA: SAM-dependent methyltransferase [Trebonia sp.]|nr:SAM-dependent methyltransferase [Trebonia sp.]
MLDRQARQKGTAMISDQASSLPFDTTVAHQARIYDYLLGGQDNFEADRAAVQAGLRIWPQMAVAARANRAFLGRVVRYLAGPAGIRQFLDLGAGIPAAGNTHQIAQQVAPESRVVYVDYDPVVLAHAQALLASGPAGATDYLHADVRDTAAVLAPAGRLLDLARPVAVMMLTILHVMPDSDDPYGIVARVMDAVPSGSYLAISHMSSDLLDQETQAGLVSTGNRMSRQQLSARDREQVTEFFAGLDLVPPGLVPVEEWRPDPGTGVAAKSATWGAVARKG